MILSGLTFITFSIIAAAVLIHRLLQWRNRSLVYSLLPGPRRQHPIIGDLPILVGRSKPNGINFHVCLLQSMLGLAHVFRKEGLCRIWFAHDPYVMLFTAETIEPVLTSQALIEKGHIYDSFRCWLKTGLITSTGNKWQKRRKLLTPTFHYRILDDFIPIFDQHSKRFAEKLSAHTKQDCLNIWHLVTVFALEVICETAMGMKSGSNKKEFLEYVESIIGFGDIFMKKFAKPWLQNDLIFSLTSDYPRHKKILNTLHEFTSKVLKQRKKELLAELAKASSQEMNGRDENNLGAKQRKAFLDLLLECQLKDSSLTDEDICEEVNTFMFAGHDTTSSGISWTLYHLGRHPKIQEKVYEEIQEILGDGEDRVVTLKDVNEMKYLERVIKESQRISPSVPMISRLASEDITINGYTIPRGSTLLMLIIALHHDPSVFPNPEIFDPDRFLLENSVERHPFSYIPFSAGSRNCIGQRFAMLEMKVTLCNIIKKFVFQSWDPPDHILQTALMILKPMDGLKLKFKKRR